MDRVNLSVLVSRNERHLQVLYGHVEPRERTCKPLTLLERFHTTNLTFYYGDPWTPILFAKNLIITLSLMFSFKKTTHYVYFKKLSAQNYLTYWLEILFVHVTGINFKYPHKIIYLWGIYGSTNFSNNLKVRKWCNVLHRFEYHLLAIVNSHYFHCSNSA